MGKINPWKINLWKEEDRKKYEEKLSTLEGLLEYLTGYIGNAANILKTTKNFALVRLEPEKLPFKEEFEKYGLTRLESIPLEIHPFDHYKKEAEKSGKKMEDIIRETKRQFLEEVYGEISDELMKEIILNGIFGPLHYEARHHDIKQNHRKIYSQETGIDVNHDGFQIIPPEIIFILENARIFSYERFDGGISPGEFKDRKIYALNLGLTPMAYKISVGKKFPMIDLYVENARFFNLELLKVGKKHLFDLVRENYLSEFKKLVKGERKTPISREVFLGFPSKVKYVIFTIGYSDFLFTPLYLSFEEGDLDFTYYLLYDELRKKGYRGIIEEYYDDKIDVIELIERLLDDNIKPSPLPPEYYENHFKYRVESIYKSAIMEKEIREKHPEIAKYIKVRMEMFDEIRGLIRDYRNTEN